MTSSSASVFVGNLPFDATDEELIAHFSQVGPVVSFRPVMDRETGRPKGYGFCEFRDAETALSAVRNLNELEVKGRQLRVSATDGLEAAAAAGGGGRGSVSAEAAALEHVSAVVNTLTPEELADALIAARTYVGEKPQLAHELLSKNPPLAHALVRAMARADSLLTTNPLGNDN
mmetsp:Transcript_22507/g.66322  ORF Transcript_22507/g.66322 Transcript_22507/m.66322 type:complete len:174 (+) Transcript_22507:69-590(+)|eukprot:CAMPEP_0206048292 /NCGR_PEP_ID=MMETSP1466-20131121/23728_1 /ASSEMBLY_ACC=CAM_ASM_001126 /TAXON_ID=44452 /ORGANISM="Pavlova gyrans, Strain CCMP608" /LENGTH=173 /DNA_ID=CAMNT_0053423341 /DNA_START=67 /DNA_END=588 /DNA_ORIENTATION=+